MLSPPSCPAPFDRLGPDTPLTPLVVSVPHAGRLYPPSLLAQSRLPVETLAALEDRHVDALVSGLPGRGVTVLVARRARAWIDLNRDERELDAAMIDPAPRATALRMTTKVRGGLGLIPRRIAGAGEILTRRLTAAEVTARIAEDHRPWHATIATALARAHARFGTTMLLDLHSMPSLVAAGGQPSAGVVLGDRHGRSAAASLVQRIESIVVMRGQRVARNIPYAGGYTLERHGRPDGGRHAIQIELDRALYLEPGLREPGPGMAETRDLVEAVVIGLLDMLNSGTDMPQAAE